jgi:hypothetical protein
LRAVGERIAELKFAESCQRQIEAAELQFAELERKGARGPNPRSAPADCRRSHRARFCASVQPWATMTGTSA